MRYAQMLVVNPADEATAKAAARLLAREGFELDVSTDRRVPVGEAELLPTMRGLGQIAEHFRQNPPTLEEWLKSLPTCMACGLKHWGSACGKPVLPDQGVDE